MIGLILLKGPVYPDPESDLEECVLTYARQPHAGVDLDIKPGTKNVRERRLAISGPGLASLVRKWEKAVR